MFSGDCALKWMIGSQILIYTCISTSTATITVFALPYMATEYPNFPSIALISGLMSMAKILSSFLVFIFPSRNYEIMIILGVKAIVVSLVSLLHVYLPLESQGIWIAVCMVLLTFSCGATVARAMTLTRRDDLTSFFSNCYTLGKSSVHCIELLAALAFFQYFGWTGLVVWVVCAYGSVVLLTVGSLLIRKTLRTRKTKLNPLIEDDDEYTMPEDGEDSSGRTPLLDPPEEHKISRRRRISLSVSTAMRSYDRSEDLRLGEHLGTLWADVRQASAVAWVYLVFSGSTILGNSVVCLCGVMYLKDSWSFSPSEASMTIMIPQIIVIPIFMTSLTILKTNCYPNVIIGTLVYSLVALIPLATQAWMISLVIFLVELCNCFRTSSQMQAFNFLVTNARVAKRFISISTLNTFVLRTVGFSGGAALYFVHPFLPFFIAAGCQLLSVLVLALIAYGMFGSCFPSDRRCNSVANGSRVINQEF